MDPEMKRPALQTASAGEWEVYLSDPEARFIAGESVDWSAVDSGLNRRKISLPGYAFQRCRLLAGTRGARSGSPFLHAGITASDRFPGQRLSAALKQTVFETHFSSDKFPFLADHCVHGRVVVAGACHLALVLAAGREIFGTSSYTIANVSFPRELAPGAAGNRQPGSGDF